MNPKNKVVLDFTQVNTQVDVAVMPASIAQRALKALAEQCSKTHYGVIMSDHIEDLKTCKADGDGYSAFIAKSQDFVQERVLMDNIQKENWDAYKVEEVVNN